MMTVLAWVFVIAGIVASLTLLILALPIIVILFGVLFALFGALTALNKLHRDW